MIRRTDPVRMFDHDAERALLASLIRAPGLLPDVLERLRPGHFAEPTHGLIFGAMAGIGAPVFDRTTIRARLVTQGVWTDHVAQVFEAIERAQPATRVRDAADALVTLAMRRAARAAAIQIDAVAQEENITADEIRDRCERLILQAMERVQPDEGFRPLGDFTAEAMRKIERAQRGELLGVSTGFPTLDKLTNGLQPGWLVVLGARTSHGKTALAVQSIAASIAMRQAQESVGVMSLEMLGDELALRQIQAETSITARDLREMARQGGVPADAARQLLDAAKKIASARMWIDDRGGVTIDDIERRARRLKANQPELALLVVDNLQNIRFTLARNASKVQMYEQITARLKALAKELAIPVLVLVQLNRYLDREKREPVLADLRDSGSIEMDADAVMLIHRIGDQMADQERECWPAKIILAKGRSEGVGWVPAWFFPKRTLYVEASDRDEWQTIVDKLEGNDPEGEERPKARGRRSRSFASKYRKRAVDAATEEVED